MPLVQNVLTAHKQTPESLLSTAPGILVLEGKLHGGGRDSRAQPRLQCGGHRPWSWDCQLGQRIGWESTQNKTEGSKRSSADRGDLGGRGCKPGLNSLGNRHAAERGAHRGENTLEETLSVGLPRRSSSKSSFVKGRLQIHGGMLTKYAGRDKMRPWW